MPTVSSILPSTPVLKKFETASVNWASVKEAYHSSQNIVLRVAAAAFAVLSNIIKSVYNASAYLQNKFCDWLNPPTATTSTAPSACSAGDDVGSVQSDDEEYEDLPEITEDELEIDDFADVAPTSVDEEPVALLPQFEAPTLSPKTQVAAKQRSWAKTAFVGTAALTTLVAAAVTAGYFGCGKLAPQNSYCKTFTGHVEGAVNGVNTRITAFRESLPAMPAFLSNLFSSEGAKGTGSTTG